MHVYGPVLQVHSSDVNKYTDEEYANLSRLTDRYREKFVAARTSCEEKFTELDLDLLLESEEMQPFLAATITSSKERLVYVLRLKLLEYTRRFQGDLCRFGFAGSQTHIAVCDSIYYQFNRVMETRSEAIRHDLPVHNLHLQYH